MGPYRGNGLADANLSRRPSDQKPGPSFNPSKKSERLGATPIDPERKVAGGRCGSKNRTNERPAATNRILIDILYP